jgi:hypothetical protein
MALSITVGVPRTSERDQLLSQLARLADVVRDEGVDWVEPESSRLVYSKGLSYGAVAALKRVAARIAAGEDVPPLGPGGLTAQDREFIDDEASLLRSHLICHSDSDGYYIPVALSEPLFVDPSHGIAGGGVVGSTEALTRELVACASAIGIEVQAAGSVDVDAVLATPYKHPQYAEKVAWARLYAACEVSTRTGSAIVFG